MHDCSVQQLKFGSSGKLAAQWMFFIGGASRPSPAHVQKASLPHFTVLEQQGQSDVCRMMLGSVGEPATVPAREASCGPPSIVV